MKALMVIFILMVTGCASFSESSIAGGNCNREVGYGIQANVFGFELSFGLAGDCKEIGAADGRGEAPKPESVAFPTVNL